MAWGTLRKHLTKPSEQVAATDWKLMNSIPPASSHGYLWHIFQWVTSSIKSECIHTVWVFKRQPEIWTSLVSKIFLTVNHSNGYKEEICYPVKVQASPLTVTPVTLTFRLQWQFCWSKKGSPYTENPGYSDILLTVILFGRPNPVTVSREACILKFFIQTSCSP